VRFVLRCLAISGVAAALVSPAAVSASVRVEAKPTGPIIVSAAASLTEAFTRIGEKFEKRYDGTDVTFNFDASSALALQIQGGAPADVFASADEASMDKLVDDEHLTAKPVVFARNDLMIATKPGNPEKIGTLADLAAAGTIALCAAAAPCGKYADAALAAAGVSIPLERITRGVNAKATLTAVSEGDAEAAIVYVTDVKAAGMSVKGVVIPGGESQIATYLIAVVAETSSAKTARAFVEYVSSTAGQKVLKREGFLAP
jgi:molybdate transport system substrate-binding protein